ncbi:MAG: type I restriction enzyme HsdR N-terminal domain-containing protein [Saprospiraceae bacterium]
MLKEFKLEQYHDLLLRKEKYIFDPIRKKWLVETKEELVRQLMLAYLTQILKYGSGRIAVEKKVLLGKSMKRFDILIYDEHLNPYMLIECKSYEIKIKQDAIYQASRYNIALKAPYICITNGSEGIAAKVDFHSMKIEYLEELPGPY